MREVEFKGKRVDNGEWVYGSLVIDGSIPYIYVDVLDRGEPHYFQVIPETVCQYIGKKDKNNKKIFEYDIVKFYETFNKIDIEGIVEYNSACQYVVKHRFTYDESMWKKDKVKGFAITKSAEVIGNIHDVKQYEK